ncbi:hypothetical protein V5O48_003944 [Marasmius crinis-equi]|uniref:Uncharacterized protein n=1 Tax=Marasmius crinis-equi TaxID=585013 RepID=A0ABR3FRE9_9AGAR
MPHLQVKCDGYCLRKFAATLDLQDPANDVPHGDLELQCKESEVFFALAARLTPKVLDACRCLKRLKHPADIIYVGNRLKLKRWDEKVTKCGCAVFLFQWEDSTAQCMWDAYMCWADMLREYDDFIEETETAASEGDSASEQHQKKRIFQKEYL